MIYYIYQINFLCGEQGRYYIGKHCAYSWNAADKYTGSGKFCHNYFKHYGKQNGVTYTKSILYFADTPEELLDIERLYVGDLYKTDKKCVNMKPGGIGSYDYSLDARQKISNANKGKKHSPEYGDNISKKLKGRTLSQEHIQHLSDSHMGKLAGIKFSEEHKRKLSEAHKGRKFSEEHKRKLSEAHKKNALKNNK